MRAGSAARLLVSLAACLALLAGCAPASAPETDAPLPTAPGAQRPETPAAEEPDAPFGLAWQPSAGLNPYDCTVLSNRAALSLICEPLFTVDGTYGAAPYLAESLTSSGDGRSHTLVLREGVTFSDGTALTAADAAASIQAARDSAWYGSRLDVVATVTAVSDRELTITTSAACGSLDALLNVYVVQAASVGAETPVGTGPYRVENGSLVRTDWWRDAAPAVEAETISLTAVTSAAELRDQFEYGPVTVACVDPNAGARLTYHTDYELWNLPTTVLQYIAFNRNSPVFSHAAARQAVLRAVDREALAADTAGGFAVASALPAPPDSSRYDADLAAEYGCDMADAASILEAAGAAAGEDGVLTLPTDDGTQTLRGTLLVCGTSEQRVAAAQAVVDALNSLGFSLTLRTEDYSGYVSALNSGSYDVYYGEARLSPTLDLSPFFDQGGSLSYGSMADSEAAGLCDLTTENEGNAYDLYRYVLEQGLLCPVLFKTYAVYADRGSVSGLQPCLDGVFTLPLTEQELGTE